MPAKHEAGGHRGPYNPVQPAQAIARQPWPVGATAGFFVLAAFLAGFRIQRETFPLLVLPPESCVAGPAGLYLRAKMASDADEECVA